jgi:hypothetical protein
MFNRRRPLRVSLMYDPPRVCKRLLLRMWLVGLPKCIRPIGGTSLFLASMVIRARLAS